MSAQSHFRTKRVFESAEASDGMRVLVDRMWPRGLRKEDAHIDIWLKDIAPSPALRQWIGHDPHRWTEFKRRYYHELVSRRQAVERLQSLAESHTVTLVYAAQDVAHNQARALAEYLS
jgi:uncharacterized protein YeaO (DUF488 family)